MYALQNFFRPQYSREFSIEYYRSLRNCPQIFFYYFYDIKDINKKKTLATWDNFHLRDSDFFLCSVFLVPLNTL